MEHDTYKRRLRVWRQGGKHKRSQQKSNTQINNARDLIRLQGKTVCNESNIFKGRNVMYTILQGIDYLGLFNHPGKQ